MVVSDSKNRVFIKSLIIFLLSLINNKIVAQELTPSQYFGSSYTDAISYYQDQKAEIVSFFSTYNISAQEAIAIVFPEIIRYNRFRDFAETTALEVIYVQAGKDIADFSIGRFQMKPSFVESIEHELLSYKDLSKTFVEIISYDPNISIEYIRNERIERLKQELWQLKYLACFIRLAEKRFATELNNKPQERLMILSSAYNKGLNSTYEELKELSVKKTFPFGTTINGRFSYFNVSNYFFTHCEDKL